MNDTAAKVGITDVGQIAINAKDLQRAIGFYRDVLGLPFLFEIPNAAFFQAGPVRLMVGSAETAEFDHPASILYYRVPDIRAAFAALTAASVQIVHEPRMIAKMPDHDLWMGFFRDSEDNVAALMSEVRGS
ncbi:MAG TPA: VOC family protein [Longimicrobium sp.]|jgi:methylmalonyl-CoA/ethylmalonyl-CoA epimerase